jgi:L-asparagine oxygenase
VHELLLEEHDQLEIVTRRLQDNNSPSIDDQTIDLAHLYNGMLPARLTKTLADFRRFGNSPGVLLVRNVPIDRDLPLTPSVPNSVATECTTGVAALLLVMTHLGDPISYSEEKNGDLVHDICPIAGEEKQQENTGSVYFEMHTENAFHPAKPDFLALLCLRPDHSDEARLVTSSAAKALPLLSPVHRETLREPRFQTRLAPSFCRGRAERPYLPPAPVLTGPDWRPAICVDFDDTRPGDPQAAQAFEVLHDALWEVRQEFALASGDMAIIDNTMTLHGRTAFTPRYDGYDRWLQRLFTVRSLSNVVDLVAADSIFRCLPLLENPSFDEALA